MKVRSLGGIATMAICIAACSPIVKVEAPEKPIVVDLNIKIDHTLKVQLHKDIDAAIAKNPDIFS